MRKRIFYGWWVVLATSMVHFWGAGILSYSFTAFFNPLVQDFRWSYSATSFAASFRSLESGVAAPVVGFLVDRFGSRRLIFLGSVVAGFGCVMLSRIDSLWSFYVYFIIFSIGSSFMHPLPGWTAINHWFRRKRGTAMGVLMAVTGFSGILIPVVTWLIAQYGWRTTFVISGVMMWVIGIPASLVVRQRPEKYGYLPDGDEPSAKQAAAETPALGPAEESGGYSVRQALRTRAFWILAAVATVSSATLHAVTVHVMPSLISVGISREIASSIAALMVISSVAGRLGVGWLSDRMNKKYLLAFSIFLQAVGVLVFAYTSTVWQAIVFLALYGPGFGGVITLRLAMQGEYFGRKAFGSIQGLTQAMFLAGNIVSPLFAGWVYDTWGSYQWAWLVTAILVFISVPLALMLKAPRDIAPAG